MICGHCKQENSTVEHVRGCATLAVTLPPLAPQYDRRRAPVTEPGVYYDGANYYKVVLSQNDNLYAKVWAEGGEWVYAPGVMRYLYADQKIDAAQAARFGRLWGTCVFCSRRLTDERSVDVGYGPVCAERNGLPWGLDNLTPDEQTDLNVLIESGEL